MHGQTARWIENGLAVLGGLIAAGYVGLAEALPRSGLVGCAQPHVDHGFPWGVVVLVASCVLPKTLGRVTAGRWLDALATRLRGGSGAPPA